jgi:hypothetical protein
LRAPRFPTNTVSWHAGTHKVMPLPNKCIQPLDGRIVWIAHETEFLAAKGFTCGIEVDGNMRTHRMHITPVALQRIALIIGRSTTRKINALDCSQTELCQIGIIPVILNPLFKGDWPGRADNVEGAGRTARL